MRKQFASLEEMIEALRARGVREVALVGKVVTTTRPGGEQIAFRGRVSVLAEVGEGEQLEYTEQVAPRRVRTRAPELPISAETAGELQQAQLSLASQLRAYREEYQGVMNAARARLAWELARRSIAIVEPRR